MPTTKLYPQTTDTFNADEIAVTNGVKSDNIPAQAWKSSGLILRFLDSPTIDPDGAFSAEIQFKWRIYQEGIL